MRASVGASVRGLEGLGRRRRAVACAIGMAAATIAMSGGAALVACSDLFHATDDIHTACELDASDDACKTAVDVDAMSDAPPDAAPDAPLDFCTWDAARARKSAETACMLLGMCEEPMGKQRFGECMAHALLAYDCNANPNRKVKGPTRDFWTCMASVTECGGVGACTYPVPQGCPAGTFVACGQVDSTAATRVDCPGQIGVVPKTENCAAWGQTCAAEGPFSVCSGDTSFRCATPAASACTGTALSDCPIDGGNNLGVDCKSFGVQACVTNGGLAACAAEGAKTCTPTTAVTCDGDVARGCPSGVEEKVDCAAITLRPGTCDAFATPSAALGVASACFAQTSCDDGGSSETCAGSAITSCFGGVVYSVACANGCTFATTPDGVRAACRKP